MHMRFRNFMALWLSLAGLAPAAPRAVPQDSLQATFARMDQAAARFRTMSANIRMLSHTAVINDDIVDSGTILLKRERPNEIRVLMQVSQPDLKTYAIQGRKAEIYYPKAKTVDEYDLGKYRDLVAQFMLLGFGSTSRDLQSGYSIKLVGSQTIGGQPSTELELIPKSKDVRQQLSKVLLWISDATGYPVQQQFFTATEGDYRLVTYSDTKINPPISDSALKLQLPAGVKREKPQK